MALLEEKGANWSYTDHDLIEESGWVFPKRIGSLAVPGDYILAALADEATSPCIRTWVAMAKAIRLWRRYRFKR